MSSRGLPRLGQRMIGEEFKTESEVNESYVKHLESLIISGQEFDEGALRADWDRALVELHKD